MKKKNEERLSFLWLEDDSFGHLVVYLEEKELSDFLRKSLYDQNFKLYFWRLLYGWSRVLNGWKNPIFLDFVDDIMHKSLRA